jgi:UDP-3-O-[3-hydroxymyristoyl] N-acetylglucosamine deacetylase
MSDIYQKTFTDNLKFEGIGLHSGKKSKLLIKPAKEDEGIVFERSDLNKNNLVKANYKNVTSARLCTTLENDFGVKISTVEHLLAALYLSDIDNAIIEIDSDEVPIMDGSAKDFLEEFKKAKIKILSKKRKYLKVVDKIELADGEKKISIEPSDKSLEVDFQLDYENKIIGKQNNIIDFGTDDLHDVSSSRTFCLFKDIEEIKKAGLAKGGSLDNAIVVDDNIILNSGGLRNDKEFVNHKILDLAGDFLLSGYRIIGKVVCYQGGHELTNKFLRKLFDNKTSVKVFENKDVVFTENLSLKQTSKIAVNA